MLSRHPANLLLRLVLEVTGLVAIGQWGWEQSAPPLRYLLAFGIPIACVLIWMVFTAPGEPGRSGRSLVPVPGRVRLAVEILFFGFATGAMISSNQLVLAGAFVFALLLQFFWSAERVVWLARN